MAKDEIQIIKIGGDVVDNQDVLEQLLHSFANLSVPRILVHGGGVMLNTLAEKMSIPVNMIDGRRITDSDTLDLALMVYSGLINTKLVARLQSLDCPAIGLTGADGGTITAIKRPVKTIDYGLVGDVTSVNKGFLKLLISSGYVPVVCALTCDTNGQMLNTNADTIASEISIALADEADVRLTYVLNQPGVLEDIDDENTLIEKLNNDQYIELKDKNQISGGMIPKLDNGYQALQNGVISVNITNNKDITSLSGTQLEYIDSGELEI